jgi:hypothetical protein
MMLSSKVSIYRFVCVGLQDKLEADLEIESFGTSNKK